MNHKKAPDFTLPDQDGIDRSLTDYRGRWVVLYFYPRDNSLNCVREACSFRDEYHIIRQFGNAEVIAINKDAVASHKKFAKKHSLKFPVLSDSGHKITSLYGAWKGKSGMLIDRPFATRRNTYIINPEGYIVKKYLGINPKDHVERIISDIQLLQAQLVN